MDEFPPNVKLLSTHRFIKGGKSSDNFENFERNDELKHRYEPIKHDKIK